MQDITVETKDTTSRDMTGWGQTHAEDKNKKTKTENSRGMLALYTGDILLESVCEGVCVCWQQLGIYIHHCGDRGVNTCANYRLKTMVPPSA